jgi:hypothetical protein
MPLDERIQRLSETIIEEVRGPIEEALRHLLTDVMLVAAEDRDQAVQSALSAAAADHEASLVALRERAERDRTDSAAALREQFAVERDAALTSLREELERGRASAVADLRAELEPERDTAVANVRAALERERDEAVARRQDELAREHETAVEALRKEAARVAAEAAGAVALTAALADAERARHEAETRATALEQELERARRELEDARRAADEAAHSTEQARQEVEQARSDASAARHAQRNEEQARLVAEEARGAAEQATETAEQRRLTAEQSLELAHAADRQQELACSDRTLAAFKRLDDARSLSEILCILADQAETEIGRAAILLVTGSRLRAWEWRNLPAADTATLDVPVDPASVFGLAIASGLPASTSDAPLGADGDTLAALLAAPPDRAGLAVPISVGGRVVAILYADDAGDRTPVVPSSWPELAEILARHAGRCLELLTISHASVLAGRALEERAPAGEARADASPLADERREEESARRYARLLISEIKLYNEAAMEQGRAERDLLTRLGPEIERARRLYEEKIPAAVRRRVDCFDDELVRTLAGGDAGLLGQS